MRAEALDITIESRSGAVLLKLSGPFHNEQAPNIREKIMGMIEDGNRDIVVDLNEVTHVDPQVPEIFLELLNAMKGKEGLLRFVFRNDEVTRAFAPHRNLLPVYPSEEALAAGGLVRNVKRRAQVLFRRTGVRISRPVALFLLFILLVCFLSVAFIIHLQNDKIHEQAAQIDDLTRRQREATLEMEEMRARLKPMEQLGLLPDSTGD